MLEWHSALPWCPRPCSGLLANKASPRRMSEMDCAHVIPQMKTIDQIWGQEWVQLHLWLLPSEVQGVQKANGFTLNLITRWESGVSWLLCLSSIHYLAISNLANSLSCLQLSFVKSLCSINKYISSSLLQVKCSFHLWQVCDVSFLESTCNLEP